MENELKLKQKTLLATFDQKKVRVGGRNLLAFFLFYLVGGVGGWNSGGNRLKSKYSFADNI